MFTRDGTPPLELLHIGRAQLAPYTTVEMRTGVVVDARPEPIGFTLTLADGAQVTARMVLLAYGVKDELPPIPRIDRLWGKSVVHCPYCHGFEVRDQPFAVYGRGEPVVEFVRLLRGWSRDLVICSNGPAELADEQRALLARQDVRIREEAIERLEADGDELRAIVFADGSELPCRALFIRPPQQLPNDLATRLNCQLTDHGLIAVNEWGASSIAGVFAAGDVATPMQQVIRAAAMGATAAAHMNHALTALEFV